MLAQSNLHAFLSNFLPSIMEILSLNSHAYLLKYFDANVIVMFQLLEHVTFEHHTVNTQRV